MIPVVLVIRDPDEETNIQLFEFPEGQEPILIDIDLGASFDIGHVSPGDIPEMIDYADGLQERLDGAPLPGDHPARAVIEGEIARIRAAVDEWEASPDGQDAKASNDRWNELHRQHPEWDDPNVVGTFPEAADG